MPGGAEHTSCEIHPLSSQGLAHSRCPVCVHALVERTCRGGRKVTLGLFSYAQNRLVVLGTWKDAAQTVTVPQTRAAHTVGIQELTRDSG